MYGWSDALMTLKLVTTVQHTHYFLVYRLMRNIPCDWLEISFTAQNYPISQETCNQNEAIGVHQIFVEEIEYEILSRRFILISLCCAASWNAENNNIVANSKSICRCTHSTCRYRWNRGVTRHHQLWQMVHPLHCFCQPMVTQHFWEGYPVAHDSAVQNIVNGVKGENIHDRQLKESSELAGVYRIQTSVEGLMS